MFLKDAILVLRTRWLWIGLTVVVALTSYEIWVHSFAPRSYEAAATVTVTRKPHADEVFQALGLRSGAIAADLVDREVLRLAAGIVSGELSAVASRENATEAVEIHQEFLALDSQDGETEHLLRELERGVEVFPGEREGSREIHVVHADDRLALIFAKAVAHAARMHWGARVEEMVGSGIARLRLDEEIASKELDEAIAARVASSKELGIADLEQRESLLRSLLLKTEEEIHQLESTRLELAHVIDSREVDAAATGRESRNPVQPDGGSSVPSDDVESGDSAATTSAVARGDEHVPDADDDSAKHQVTVDDAGALTRALEEELARVRLEYEVRSASLPEQHPRVIKLRERMWQIESLMAARDREHTVQQSLAPATPQSDRVIEEYRRLSVRVEGLHDKRERLFRDLLELQEVRPRLAKFEERTAAAAQRLEDLRSRLAVVDRLEGETLVNVSVERIAQTATLIALPGAGPLWRFGVIAAAALVGFLLAWGLEVLDTRFHSDSDVGLFLQLPLLASVPRMGKHARYELWTGANRGVVERFNAASTLLHSVSRELDMQVFAVSSATSGEGRTTVALHLATALARKGLKVALVDGDLRRPELHDLLGIANDSGLTTLLDRSGRTQEIVDGRMVGIEEDEEGMEVFELLQETGVENLFVLPSGPLSRSPISAIEGMYMRKVLRELRGIMDYVIIDTPAVLEAGEALALAAHADGCVFVIGSGQCDSGDALWVKHLFENVHATIVGVVLNRCVGRRRSSVSKAEQRMRARSTVEA